MFKLISVLALSFLFIAGGSAQAQKESPCRLRFAVAEKTALDRPGVWPADAIRWWAKDGKKKFPELCEVVREGADFVLVWQRGWTTERHSVMKSESPQTYGPPQPEWNCTTGLNGEEHCTLVPPLAQVSWEDYEETVGTHENRIVLLSCLYSSSTGGPGLCRR